MSRPLIFLFSTLLIQQAIASTDPATAPASRPATQPAAAVELPAPITLRAPAVAPQEAFAYLAEQGRVEIAPEQGDLWVREGRPGSMFVDVKDQPFWVAMSQLCAAANVGVRGRGGGNGDPAIVLFDRGGAQPLWGNKPHVVSGPAVIVQESAQRTDRREFHRAASAEPIVTITVQAWLDPRLDAVPSPTPLRVLEAIDERGNALRPDPNSGGGSAGDAPWLCNVSATLVLPPANAGRRIARLRAEALVIATTKSETWEIDKPLEAKDKTKHVAGAAVRIESISENGQVKLDTKRGEKVTAAEFDRYRTLLSVWARQMRLLDENGSAMRLGGWGASSGDDSFSMNLDFHGEQGPAKPAKLVWLVPVETREIALPFEMRDWVLP